MWIEVPGNLLFLGEYGVTKPGVVGIALSVEPRISIEVKPSSSLTFRGVFEGKEYEWDTVNPVPDHVELLQTIYTILKARYTSLPSLCLTIDSSLFSYDDGQKMGLGSSAAVTVGVVYALLSHLIGSDLNLSTDVFPVALEAHRQFQNGRGSGYDIMASLYGGAGLFIGGEIPYWDPISPKLFDDFYLVRGDAPVQTRGAVTRFDDFCHHSPKFATNFLLHTSKCSRRFIEANTFDDQKGCLEKASRLNRWIGRKLGVPAEGPQLGVSLQECRRMGLSAKSLGSGGEIAIVLGEPPHSVPSNKLVIASEGIRCRQ